MAEHIRGVHLRLRLRLRARARARVRGAGAVDGLGGERGSERQKEEPGCGILQPRRGAGRGRDGGCSGTGRGFAVVAAVVVVGSTCNSMVTTRGWFSLQPWGSFCKDRAASGLFDALATTDADQRPDPRQGYGPAGKFRGAGRQRRGYRLLKLRPESERQKFGE